MAVKTPNFIISIANWGKDYKIKMTWALPNPEESLHTV